MGEFSTTLFLSPPSFFFFLIISTRLWFYYIITKIHPHSKILDPRLVCLDREDFPNSQQTGEKISHPMPKFWRIPLPGELSNSGIEFFANFGGIEKLFCAPDQSLNPKIMNQCNIDFSFLE